MLLVFKKIFLRREKSQFCNENGFDVARVVEIAGASLVEPICTSCDSVVDTRISKP